jgi:hypothetical protein
MEPETSADGPWIQRYRTGKVPFALKAPQLKPIRTNYIV